MGFLAGFYMILIVCRSKGKGISFNGRRQSRDSKVAEDILEMTKNSTLYASPYSEKVFNGASAPVFTDDYLRKAGPGEYAFFEKGSLDGLSDPIERIVIYDWNEAYPCDQKFEVPKRFRFKEAKDFKGTSHERITKEVYDLEK